MKLYTLLRHLPHTLFLSSLALAAAVAPAGADTGLLVLTPDNFKETVSKGVWCVHLNNHMTIGHETHGSAKGS